MRSVKTLCALVGVVLLVTGCGGGGGGGGAGGGGNPSPPPPASAVTFTVETTAINVVQRSSNSALSFTDPRVVGAEATLR